MADGRTIRDNVVVLCTDARFLLPCAFVLDQLAADPNRDRYDVVVVHDAVPEPDLRRLVAQARRPISVVAFREGTASLDDAPVTQRLSRATYMRLYLDALLPKQYRRIVYLDSDIYLDAPDLMELFGADLHGMPFAAARDGIDIALVAPEILTDIAETWVSHAEMRGYKQALGLAPADPYVNAGVLLIDRDRWVAESLSERVLAYAVAHPGHCKFADQSALNAVKGDRWAEFSPRWNCQPIHTAAGLRKALQPRLIHFAGAYKPWNTEVWGRRFTREYQAWHAGAGWAASFPAGPTIAVDRLVRKKPGVLDWFGRTFLGKKAPADPFGPARRAEVRRAVLTVMADAPFVDLDGAGRAALNEAVARAG